VIKRDKQLSRGYADKLTFVRFFYQQIMRSRDYDFILKVVDTLLKFKVGYFHLGDVSYGPLGAHKHVLGSSCQHSDTQSVTIQWTFWILT
jgi:hypothetical protein